MSDPEPCEDMVKRTGPNKLFPVHGIGKFHSAFLHDNPAAMALEVVQHVLQFTAKSLSLRATDRDGLDFVGKYRTAPITNGRSHLPRKVNSYASES